jgi:hypothetical protein
MRHRVRSALLVLVLGVVTASVAPAQDVNHLYDRFQVSVTGAGVLLGTNLRVDTDGGDGTDIDTEDDLGLDRAGLRPRVGFRWMPGRRHQIEASYLFINRSGERAIERDITIDSVTYTAGANLASRIGSDQLAVTYRYAFRVRESSLIGVSVGAGATFFKGEFSGTGTVTNGDQTETGTFSLKRSLTGPSLAVGLFGQWRLSPAWYLGADLRALYVPVDNIDISVLDGGAFVRYFPLHWLGLEGGYSLSSQRVEVVQKDDPLVDVGFSGRVRYLTQNLRLGVVAAF